MNDLPLNAVENTRESTPRKMDSHSNFGELIVIIFFQNTERFFY